MDTFIFDTCGGIRAFCFTYVFNSNKKEWGAPLLVGCASLALLSFWVHFIFPIQWIFSTLFLILGWLYFFIFYKQFYWNKSSISLLLFLVFLLSLIFTGSPGFTYDTGLYHLQLFQWIQKEPVVFGLANIHGRFGFNSIWMYFYPVFHFNSSLSTGYYAGAVLFHLGFVLFLMEYLNKLMEIHLFDSYFNCFSSTGIELWTHLSVDFVAQIFSLSCFLFYGCIIEIIIMPPFSYVCFFQ